MNYQLKFLLKLPNMQKKGVIIADTKFEFALNDSNLIIIDDFLPQIL